MYSDYSQMVKKINHMSIYLYLSLYMYIEWEDDKVNVAEYFKKL